MMTSATAPVVLFDLDGVLTRRDTFTTLVTRRLRASPWRLMAAAPALPLLALTRRWPEGRAPLSRYLVRVALFGLSVERAEQIAVDLGAEFAANIEWLNPAVIDTARRHIAAGDDVVVVTATEHQLARTLLDALGLTGLRLVASEMRAVRGGVGLRPHNYGRRKLRGLQEHGVSRPWAVLYTDSLADAPVADRVSRVVLVDARADLLDKARRRFRPPVTTMTGTGS
jgi:phosphatidylglycerophosphatase C